MHKASWTWPHEKKERHPFQLSAPQSPAKADRRGDTRGSGLKYRTIVADPPWEQGERPGWSWRQGRPSGEVRPLPYSTMSVEEIKALPVKSLAQSDVAGNRPDKSVPRDGSTLYLWTTTQFLYQAHDVARVWGFEPQVILVWCKAPRGFGVGGTFKNNVEFVVVARRGSPPKATGSSSTRWFEWPRGEHSSKPDAFYDLVEQVSPGPYLEMFARRARFGWDYYGDESLQTVDIEAA